MNIEQKELINIIREELAEALGMDASYDRQNLTMKLVTFLTSIQAMTFRQRWMF